MVDYGVKCVFVLGDGHFCQPSGDQGHFVYLVRSHKEYALVQNYRNKNILSLNIKLQRKLFWRHIMNNCDLPKSTVRQSILQQKYHFGIYAILPRSSTKGFFFFFFNKHPSFFRQFDPHELFWFCCFITITLALRFLNDKPPKVMFLVHLLVVHLLRAILPVEERYALFTNCLSSVN